MDRRKFFLALTLSPLSCLVAPSSFAQTEPVAKLPNTKRPFRAVNATEDGRRVIFFFDFGCPFCAKYHDPMMNWASTVPNGVQTMFVPVVNMADITRKQEQIIAAKCYYAAFQIATKEQMARFTSSVYSSYETSHSLLSKELWTKAAQSAGIDLKSFAREMRSSMNETQVRFANRKTIQYDLHATPSVGIGGKYVLTPDDVLGDQTMFFNILNGLTSEIL